MIEEIHILGVYLPTSLVLGLGAALAAWLFGKLLAHLPVVNWHPHLVDLTLFLVFWVGLESVTDSHPYLLELM